jgi:hypothetical protein
MRWKRIIARQLDGTSRDHEGKNRLSIKIEAIFHLVSD